MSARRSAARALRVGSIGGLLPLLTVAGASCLLDRREALSAPPEGSKTSSSDCVSTTALLVYRGLGAGLAWTIGVDGYFLASLTDAEWKQRVAARPGSSVAREAARWLGRLSVRNTLGFAGFLGIFGGVSCSLEKVRGKNDPLNPFVGGFTAGMAILTKEVRQPRALLAAALLCGSASMALHCFIPSGENKSEGATETSATSCSGSRGSRAG
ncbi:RxLR effector candidate protein [Phytophthora cinnamomi]|uniref:RxLR effector candidate protein n=1 Tax=Phytophthora cinnamomi TaxID=4785 RepID=UPI00355A8F3D|nr:RxLR effector candidate protein [Phytophthora cinnamomi]